MSSINTARSDESILGDIIYKKLVIKSTVQFAGLFYLVYGVFIAYVWTSIELDVKSRNLSITIRFWTPVITIYTISNLAVLIMILLNKYWSHTSQERRILTKPDDYLMICFILIPLFLGSSIFNIIKLMRDLSIKPCHGYTTALVPLGTLALTTGAAIIIFDVEYFTSTSKSWAKELMKSHLVFFTVIGLTNSSLISVALLHMNIFRKESYNSSYQEHFRVNDSCLNSKNVSFYLDSLPDIFRPTHFLFCICALIYFFQQSLQGGSKSKFVQLEPIEVTDDTDLILNYPNSLNEQTDSPLRKVSYRLPSISLVLCIVVLSMSFLSFIIMYSLRQKVTNDSHTLNVSIDTNWNNNLGSLIFCAFIVLIYAIGSGLSISHIVEIKKWPMLTNGRSKVIDECLIWIGAGGQLSLCLTTISKAAIWLGKKNNDCVLQALLCMLIISSLFLVVQTFLQTIQISLLLDRKWNRPEINSLAESLCPAVGMMGLNMGLLLLSIDQLKSPILSAWSDMMFIDMAVMELKSAAETLCILQRLHASLMFASMIVYTHN